VCLYDTVPAAITYINSSVAPTSGPPNLMWCIGSVAPNGTGTITWWGQITSYPFDPFFHMHFYFAEVDEDPMVRVSGFPDLWDRERVNGILLE
jgi:hypothetical protein